MGLTGYFWAQKIKMFYCLLLLKVIIYYKFQQISSGFEVHFFWPKVYRYPHPLYYWLKCVGWLAVLDFLETFELYWDFFGT